MRIHVVGHSSSKIDDAKEPDWPVRVRSALEGQLQAPVELTASRLAPYGPRAVDYAALKVSEAAPDVVVLSVSAFACTVGLVSLGVRRRFGVRAMHRFEAVERRYSRLASGGPVGGARVDRLLRALARRTIGTATLAPVDEVGSVYAEILHNLARDEHLHVVVLGESFFSEGLQRANPGMVQAIERLRAIVKPVATAHRFSWLDVEAAYRDSGDRGRFFHSDGVHNTPAGHQRVAELVAADILRSPAVTAPGASPGRGQDSSADCIPIML